MVLIREARSESDNQRFCEKFFFRDREQRIFVRSYVPRAVANACEMSRRLVHARNARDNACQRSVNPVHLQVFVHDAE